LLLPWETFTPISVVPRLFVFELGARTGQTDGQTDGQDPQCGLWGRPHNTHHCFNAPNAAYQAIRADCRRWWRFDDPSLQRFCL